jgi:hypothetical protein
VLVVASLGLAACSAGENDGAPASSTATPSTDVASPSVSTTSTDVTTSTSVPEREPQIDPVLVRIGELVDDEGVLPIQTAAAIFSATIAPLPGVDPLELDGDLPPDLAGAAARRLGAPDVPAELAAAVDAALEPTEVELADEATIAPGDGRRREIPVPEGDAVEPTRDELADTIATVVADFEARTGHNLRLPIRARVVADRSTGGDAVTTPITVGERTTACRIALPRGLFGSDAASATSTIAHEVWHCFQLDANEAAFDGAPLWIIEGQAEYAGEAYVGGSSSSASSWDTWLLSVDSSLYRRSYDAIGLYAVAAATGRDVWPAMLTMLGRGNAAAVEELFGQSLEESALAVATAVVRTPAVGEVWESTGPGITGAQAAPVMSLPDGDVAELSLALGRIASFPVVLAVTAGDIARVGVQGGTAAAVQLTGSDLVRLAPGSTVSFCLRPEGCVCPDGSNPGGGAELPPAEPGEGAAAIAATDAADATITGGLVTLEDACRRDLVGVWETDAGAVIAAFTGPFGGAGAIACSGPYRLTFTADGAITGAFSATCGADDLAGTAQGNFAGRYTNDESTFVVTDGVGGGSFTLGPVTQPLPIFDGFTTTNPVPYSLAGDVLTITIAAAGASVPLQLTRTG